MAAIRETTVAVPAEFVRQCCGLSLDIGGSVFKAVYRSKENLEEASKPDCKLGHLQLVSISRASTDEALEYVKQRAILSRSTSEEQVLVHTTGVGCTEKGKPISQKLNIKLENVVEFDCFVKSFYYLVKHLSRADLFEPFLIEAAMEPVEIMKEQIAVMKACVDENQTSAVNFNTSFNLLDCLGQVVNDSQLPVIEVEKDLFPCMLVMCGSGIGFMQVNADGTFKLLDGTSRGGRAFVGLGSLITDSKSFDELMELASNGNPRNVDTFSDDLFSIAEATEEDNSLYAKTASVAPSLIYCFGKCGGQNKSDFKREDLARSLLNQFLLDLVQTASLVALVAGVHRICMSGSLVSAKLVRSIITTEMSRRNMFAVGLGRSVVKLDFIQPGPHLGALGALVDNYEKNNKK